MKEKIKRINLRLTITEEELFKRKASSYQTVSRMVVDAVRLFDDTGTKRKIAALNEMTAFYKKYQQDLSWIGGNFNQVVKRANELAIGNELTVPFFENVLYPQIMELQELLTAIKQDQHQIAKRLTR